MRRVAGIALHNIKILASEKSSFFWLLGMPIVFTLVAGFAFSGRGGGGEPVRYALTVANLDEGPHGEELLDAMREADEIDLMPVEGPDAGAEARRLVEDGDRSAALVVPPDYSSLIDASEPASLVFHRNPERMNPIVTRQAVEKVVARLNALSLSERAVVEAYSELRGEPSEEKRRALVDSMRGFVSRTLDAPPLTMAVERLGRPAESEVPDMGLTHSSPAMALMFVLLNGLMLSTMIVEERRQKTLSRLFSAPVRRAEIVAANLGWRFLVGTVQLWFLIGFGVLVFGVDWGDSLPALFLVGVGYVAATAGLSVLIGSLSRSSKRAETLSLVLALTMCALGGLWWPLEITPKAYQTVGHLVPTGWAMDAMHNMVGRGYTMAGVAPQILVLIAFAVGFSVAAVAAFRYE